MPRLGTRWTRERPGHRPGRRTAFCQDPAVHRACPLSPPVLTITTPSPATEFCVPAHLTKEARIRHDLPVSPAPCPKTVFGRVHTGCTREHLPPHGGLSWLQIAQAVPARSSRARDQRGCLRAVLADPEMFPSPRVIRTGYHASPTDASRARRGRQGSGRPEDQAPARHAEPATQIRDMSRPAGEDKPRRVTGCPQEATKTKRRPP